MGWEISGVASVAGGCLFILIFVSFFRAKCLDMRSSAEKRVPTDLSMRFISCAQSFFAMLMSWSLSRVSFWIVKLWLPDNSMATVTAAFFCFFGGVFAVIVLDKLADKMIEAPPEELLPEDAEATPWSPESPR